MSPVATGTRAMAASRRSHFPSAAVDNTDDDASLYRVRPHIGRSGRRNGARGHRPNTRLGAEHVTFPLMGARIAVMALACSLMLSGCTDGRSESPPVGADSPQPSASLTTSQPPTSGLAFVGPDSPVVQRLWQPIESLTLLRTNLPSSLDFAAIRQAPLITESPIGPAVLAVGTEPRPYNVGDPAVVNAAGEWRVIERDALGMRNPGNVEQQFELSPDGSVIALGDQYGIVFLDLTTGESTRVEVGVSDPVIHAWTWSGAGVLITRRGLSKEAWEVRMNDASVSRVPFDPWTSSVRRDGSVAELVAQTGEATAGAFTEVRIWRRSRVIDTRPLRVGVPRQAFVANEGDNRIGFRQDRRRKTKTTGGFGVIDTRTGDMVGFLDLPSEPLVWVSQQGQIGARWIILNVSYGRGGGIFAWDPVGQRLRAVTRIDDQGANVSLAADLTG